MTSAMASRLESIKSHFTPSGVPSLTAKHPDDVVIVLAARSPLCKAGKGGFAHMRSDELMVAMLRATIDRMPVKPAEVEDICVGIVQGASNTLDARAAALTAGFPETSCVQSVNRFCSSGLMAISIISNQIRNGEIECGLAMGSESLSANASNLEGTLSPEIMAHPIGKDCMMTMGETSENVASDFSIPREKMDAFAAGSHQRAEAAHRKGLLAQEILPLEALRFDGASKDPADRKKVIISEDDGLRPGTTKESLAKVRSAFPQWKPGNSTGGNSSQITDGAAVVLMMKRSKADKMGIKILGKHVATCVAGLPPRIMGIGPVYAIPKILARCNIKKEDVDLWEINEAFSSMAVYCVETLGLDRDYVNVNGGAIAFGHPFGCTGTRQVATGLSELNRRRGKILITSMCIGSGQGAAACFVGEA